KVMNELQIDRRLIASVLTFGLTAPYILLPAGFGQIFQGILAENMENSGLAVEMADIPKAMLIPVAGMAAGLIVALFVYRKKRNYRPSELIETEKGNYSKKGIIFSLIGIAAALIVQLQLDSMIFG